MRSSQYNQFHSITQLLLSKKSHKGMNTEDFFGHMNAVINWKNTTMVGLPTADKQVFTLQKNINFHTVINLETYYCCNSAVKF